MQWSDLPRNPSKRTLTQFGALCFLFGSSLASWEAFARHRPLVGLVLGGLAIVFGFVGWIRPMAMRPIFVGWMIAAFPIGWVVSRTVLAFIFYGIFAPIGLLFRLAGRDPLLLRRPAARTSYWMPKPGSANARSYFRQY